MPFCFEIREKGSEMMARFLLYLVLFLLVVGTILAPVEYIFRLPLTPVDDLKTNDTSYIIKIDGLRWANEPEHIKSAVIRMVDENNNEYFCKRTLIYPQLLLDANGTEYNTPLIVIGRPIEERYTCKEDGSEWKLNLESYAIYRKDNPLSSIPLFSRLLSR